MPYLKVGKDGLVIAAESPTGEDLEEGDVFVASGKWYRRRKRCSFLHVISAEEYRAALGEVVSGDDEEPDPPTQEESKISDDNWAKLEFLFEKLDEMGVDLEVVNIESIDGSRLSAEDFEALPMKSQREVVKALDLQDECDLRSSESMATAYENVFGEIEED